MGEICKDPKNPANTTEKHCASLRVMSVLLDSRGLSDTIRLLQYAIDDHNKDILQPGAKADSRTLEHAIKINELLDAAYYASKKVL